MNNTKYRTITFNDKTFEYKEVYHKAAGFDVLIGTKSLENELINEDGSYKSKYAQGIDEKFYGFLDDDLFSKLSYEEFEEYVNNNLD
jgi:hypothetical protein